jgi:hypothetical protein
MQTNELISSLDEIRMTHLNSAAILEEAIKRLKGTDTSEPELPAEKLKGRKANQVERYLRKLGVPPYFKGYKYVSSAVETVLEKPDILHGRITKELYPHIASKYPGATPARVERGIRYAIETIFLQGDADNLHKTFVLRTGQDKPTNAAFIAILAEMFQEAS